MATDLAEERHESPEWTPHGTPYSQRSHPQGGDRVPDDAASAQADHGSQSTMMPLRRRPPPRPTVSDALPLPDFSETGSEDPLSDRDGYGGDGWFGVPAVGDIVLIGVVAAIGLALVSQYRNREELFRITFAMTAYGVSVGISMVIIRYTAKSARWNIIKPSDAHQVETTRELSEVDQQLMAPEEVRRMQAALSQAQVEVTALQLKVNYYNSELHRQREERSRDKDELLRQQRVDLSKVFSLMVKHSPHPVRDALEISTEPVALVSSRAPFIILHVNCAWIHTFNWDAHEIIGCDLNFFRGMLMDGVTWDRLLETLALYGYAAADVLNAGSDGGFFLHSMTITPLVDTDPSSINGADVALAGHVVRSKVRKLARVPADQQARFEAFMEDEQEFHAVSGASVSVGASPIRLSGPPGSQGLPRAVRRRPLEACRELRLMELLRYMGLTEEALAMLDGKGRILHVNASFSHATRATMQLAEGKTLEELLGGPSGWEPRVRETAKDAPGTRASEVVKLEGLSRDQEVEACVSYVALTSGQRGFVARLSDSGGVVVPSLASASS